MIAVLLLTLVAAPFNVSPATPTIGDSITIAVRGTPFELRPSPEFEVVSAVPDEIVIRTFRPGPLRVEWSTHRPGELPESGTLEIEVASVLARDDKLEPAPLRPPKPLPREGTAWIATGITAGIAVLLWGLLALLLRRQANPALPALPAIEDPSAAFRAALVRLRTFQDDESKWVMLSAATRRYLAATDSALGAELTSFELLVAMRRAARREPDVATVEAILRGGDWTKFSPFGAPRLSIDDLVDAAGELIPRVAEGEAAA